MTLRCSHIAVVLTVILAMAALLHGARPVPATLPEKTPVPDAVTLRQAIAHIQQVFKNDLTTARSSDAKATIAAKMLQTGVEEKQDLPGKYALLESARTLGADAGRADVAMGAVDELDGAFAIDGPAIRVDTLVRLTRAVHSSAELKPVSEFISAETEMQLALERYTGVAQLADAEFAAAKRVGDISAQGKASARLTEIRQTAAIFDDAAAGQKVLAANPTDAAASQAVGKYRCFIRGDWDGGLKLLAAAADPLLKLAAAKELAGATTPEAKVDIADAWWDIGEKERGLVQRQIRQHVGRWYQDALPDLTGLVRSKAQQRIAACSHRVSILVSAKHGRKGPMTTTVQLVKGQTFSIEPNPADTWGGGKKAPRFDYRGDPGKPGHMALMWKIADKSEAVVSGKLLTAPAAGTLLLYCNDYPGRDNQGSMRVMILVR